MGTQKRSGSGIAIGAAIAVLATLVGARPLAATELPDEAKASLHKTFPGAQIRDVEREREFGALCYEVAIMHKGKRLEVEVSPKGVLGEIESIIEPKDLPKAIAQAIAGKLKSMEIIKIEKHERRGSARSGAWVPFATPVVFYDVKYRDGNRRRSLILNAKGTEATDPDDGEDREGGRDGDAGDEEEAVAIESLPASVGKAILSQYSGAKLTSATMEKKDDGSSLYEVKFTHRDKSLEAKVDTKGKISKVKEHLAPAKLPAALASALKKAYPKARVTEAEKVLSGGKTVYEVELRAGRERIEIVLDESGKVLRQEADSRDDEDDDDEDGD